MTLELGRKPSDEIVSAMERLNDEGRTAREAMAYLGIGKNTLTRLAMAAWGGTWTERRRLKKCSANVSSKLPEAHRVLRSVSPKFTREKTDQFIEMHNNGATVEHISRSIGIGRGDVDRGYSALGAPKNRPWNGEHDGMAQAYRLQGRSIASIAERLCRTPEDVTRRLRQIDEMRAAVLAGAVAAED